VVVMSLSFSLSLSLSLRELLHPPYTHHHPPALGQPKMQ
jgi:hypothetical protein